MTEKAIKEQKTETKEILVEEKQVGSSKKEKKIEW